MWFGGNGATTHIWLNGQDLGEHPARNWAALEIDVTDAIKRDGNNTLVVAVDNSGINVLGTSGIMRPVLLYSSD